MAVLLFANLASTVLAGAITSTATSANLAAGTGSKFPQPGAGQYFTMTFNDAATGLLAEVVWVTAVSGDTVTIQRGMEGTTALAWLAGDEASNYWTAGSAAALIQIAQMQEFQTNTATDTGAVNAIAVTLTPAPSSYASIRGAPLQIQVADTNTSGTVTINVNGLGALPLLNPDGSKLTVGQVVAAGYMTCTYDGGGHFMLLSTATGPKGFPRSVAFVTTTETLTIANDGQYINVDTAGVLLTLPLSNTVPGMVIGFLCAASSFTLQIAAGDNDFFGGWIQGQSSVTFGLSGYVALQSNGSSWCVFDISTDPGLARSSAIPPASTIEPAMDGAEEVGTSVAYARADHVHPTDTSRAPVASPTFTGIPAAPTATAGTDTTQLASTAFVQNAIGAIPVFGRLLNVQTFNGNSSSSSTVTYTKTAGCTLTIWDVCGSGGGAGGCGGTGASSGSVSGGAGAATQGRIMLPSSVMNGISTISLTLPEAGQGGSGDTAGTNGAALVATNFFNVPGGVASPGGADVSVTGLFLGVPGGNGGAISVSNGAVLLSECRGQAGGVGLLFGYSGAFGGPGGNCQPFGVGGPITPGAANTVLPQGGNALDYGAGGAGVATLSNSNNGTGGTGGPCRAVVYEFG